MSALVPLFLDVTVSLPGAQLAKVRRYRLRDELNTVPEMTVEVFHPEVNLDLAELLGRPATALLGEPAVPRFDGVVRHVEQRALDVGGVAVYALTIVPRLWLLSQRSGHRIFQNRTALGVVADVLGPYGEEMNRPEGALLREAPRTMEYRVQWGETDHDFLFRILSEEGLVSCWSPDGHGERAWMVTDDTTTGGPDMVVPYDPASGALSAAGPHVSASAVNARLCPSEVKVRDYDPRKPGFTLERRRMEGDAAEMEEPLAAYSFAVGRFEEEAGGDRLASTLLEGLRARARSYVWEASFALRAGMKVRLVDHPREDANGDFLVVSAWSEVGLSGKRHRAEVIPAARAWRPKVSPKPRIHGTETAFVVGAPGKEIDVDGEGRIEVAFRWDTRDLRRDGASRRVRVATPWAGTDRGFWTVPRVGDEVVIAYLHGDPDQPLVVGSVNNATAPPVLPMPGCETQSWWKSKSTPGSEGYNAIVMEDRAGSELLGVVAERDSSWMTKRRSETYVGENSTTRVAGSQSVAVGAGQSTTVGGDLNVQVAGAYYLMSAGLVVGSSQAITMLATGSFELVSTSGERIDRAAVKHHIEAPAIFLHGADGVQVVTERFHVHARAELVLQVGGSSLKMTGDCIELSSPLIKLNP